MNLPHDIDLEAAALGSVLRSPGLWSEVSAIMREDDLTGDKHRAVYAAIGRLVTEGVPLDPILVANEAGVEALFVHDLEEKVVVASTHPAQRVARLAAQRRVIAEAQSIIDNAPLSDPDALVAEAVGRLQVAADAGLGELSVPADLTDEAYNDFEAHPNALSTGIPKLDVNLGGGLRPGRLYLIASRTSVGKSALATNIARHALDTDRSVLIVSLEMTGTEVLIRLVSDACDVANDNIPELIREMASLRVQQWPLRFLDRADLAGVLAASRRLQPALVVVDYLQILPVAGRFERRDLELAHVTRSLKQLAMAAPMPVLACAQLNRDPAKSDRWPRLSDLRESGAQEQDADVVILLHRPDIEKPDSWAFIAKNRGGPVGKVGLVFDGPHTRFTGLGTV